MVLFLLMGTLGTLVFGYCVSKQESVREKINTYLIGFFLSFIIGALVSGAVGGVLGEIVDYKEVITKEKELVQLIIDKQTKGKFFLGCGKIERKTKYFAYTKNDKEEISLSKYPTTSSVFVFSNFSPKVQTVRIIPKKEVLQTVFFILDKEVKYRFYVPDGSICYFYLLGRKTAGGAAPVCKAGPDD